MQASSSTGRKYEDRAPLTSSDAQSGSQGSLALGPTPPTVRVRSGRFNKSARSTKRSIPSNGAALGLAPLLLHADQALRFQPRVGKRLTLYKSGRVKGTREIVVRPNYVMVYRVTGKVVEVLRVLHVAQQWPRAAEACFALA